MPTPKPQTPTPQNMISFDFIIALFVIYGIVKLVRMVGKPSVPRAAAPQPQVKRHDTPESLGPPPGQKIVDATFDEID